MKGELNQDEEGQWWYYSPSGRRRRAYERICGKCGKSNIVFKSRLSNKCQSCGNTGVVRTSETRKKIGDAERGKKHFKYKDILTDKNGYMLMHRADHPEATKRDGYVRVHRIVMEEMIGRALTKKETVHHINGIKHDNRPANLWLFSTPSEHSRFHADLAKFNKKPHYIYLAGAISSDDKTYKWREDFETLLKEESLYRRVVIVNPCLNRFDQDLKKYIDDNSIQFLKKSMDKSQKILRARDNKFISICSILVVNLELYDTQRPLIGTLHELVWAHDLYYMPIIAIVGKEQDQLNNPYVQHSWINECCSAKVETVEEAVDIIKNFFLDY